MAVPLLDRAPRHLFFTGKGGVGKTSIACATALALAERGRRVLLVSTDPASNLGDVLERTIGSTATAIDEVPGLFALDLDPSAAAHAYRERAVAPYRGRVPAGYLAQLEEQLSGACTVEIAAFDEFARLLGSPAASAGYDHLIFDTAPTGHTLRLLSLPRAWEAFARESTSGSSCIGPLAQLAGQRALYEATVRALIDGEQTVLVLVARPERSAIAEAERTRGELAALGVGRQELVLNGLFPDDRAPAADPMAKALATRGLAALAELPPALASLPRSEVALRSFAPLGVPSLRALFGGPAAEAVAVATPARRAPLLLDALVDRIAGAGRGLVLAMGKGGVGKTTVAAALAIALARRGHRVQLTTTDPAAHLAAVMGGVTDGVELTRIDPAAETRRYTDEVMATAGAGLDEGGRALLAEDLRSPCTEEVAVFRAFARTAAAAERGFVVVDTAPTGHTLLLLDAAEAFHREVARQGDRAATPDEVRRLLPRLRDPAFTTALLVTLPEATPVREASRLQDDLRRAGIEPTAWVVNQCLSAGRTDHPLLAARRAGEARWIAEAGAASRDLVLLPWHAAPPVGAEALCALDGAGRTLS